MSKTVSIQIQIANKSYPLKVKEEQVEVLQAAAKKVAEQLKNYQTSFNLKEPQDILAMCALQQAADIITASSNRDKKEREIITELSKLSEMVNAFGPDNQ
ncbi:MAG: cell division protein ZapA [Bacteroidota bacterium]